MTDYQAKWKEFLNEVSDDELENITDVLDDLTPDKLPFSNIFGDKMRLVVPLTGRNPNVTKLLDLLDENGYAINPEKGTATYYTISVPVKDTGKWVTGQVGAQVAKHFNEKGVPKDGDELADLYQSLSGGVGGETIHRLVNGRVAKKEIKIGKLLDKGLKLYDNWKEIAGRSLDHGDREEMSAHEKDLRVAKRKFVDAFSAYGGSGQQDMPIPYVVRGKLEELAKWWSQKSEYYRNNPEAIEAVEASPYSIVYTRHPLDIMRMSDFENIESCHSPVSRTGGSGAGNYFRCAVAEAHDGGAMAYLVKNEDLDSVMEDANEDLDLDVNDPIETYQDLADSFQESGEEFLHDEERSDWAGRIGVIDPIGRIRLKKYSQPDKDTTLAVPELRIYGRRDPMFLSAVSSWARESQPEEIKKVEKTFAVTRSGEKSIDLRDWVRYGGTYADTVSNDQAVFRNLLDPVYGDLDIVGRAYVDDEVENNLSITSGLRDAWESEVGSIVDRYNDRMSHTKMEASIDDDGGEGFYIMVNATMTIKIPEDEFVYSANQEKTLKSMSYLDREINDYLGENREFVGTRHYATNGIVHIELEIGIEALNPHGSGFAGSPEELDEIGSEIDSFDDIADSVDHYVKMYLKRDGILEGGALLEFARALEDESWYEWTYELDDDWNTTSIDLESRTYVNFSDLTEQIPVKIDPKGPTYGNIYFGDSFIAEYAGLHTGDDELRGYEIISDEFPKIELGSDAGADTIRDVVRKQIRDLIIYPPNSGKTPRGKKVSYNYGVEVRRILAQNAGAVEGEFYYPTFQLDSDGPDGEGDFNMLYFMNLDENDPDKSVEGAWEMVKENDDEDVLIDAYKKAFAILAKIDMPKKAVKERIDKKQMKTIVDKIVQEHAKDFVWGVKSPGRVANQYSLKQLRILIKEAVLAKLEKKNEN